MASLVLPTRQPAPVSRRRRELTTPSGWVRASVVVAFAGPFALVGLAAGAAGWSPVAHTTLGQRGELIRWGSTDLAWAVDVYPPVGAGLWALVGGSPVALTLIGAAAIGFMLQVLTAALGRSQVSVPVAAVVVATLVVTPPLHVVAGGGVAEVLALVGVIYALDRVVPFVRHGSTEAGIRAGLALSLVTMLVEGGWVWTVVLALLGPLFAVGAQARDRHRFVAVVLVLVYPTVAAIGFWSYLGWWFGGDLGGALGAVLRLGPGTGGGPVWPLLVVCPLLLMGLWERARTSWGSAVGPVAVLGSLGLAAASGAWSVEQVYVAAMAVFVVGLAPAQHARPRPVLLGVLGGVQVVLVVVWSVAAGLGQPWLAQVWTLVAG